MAISDDVPGLEIFIVADGRMLVEYQDKEVTEDERTTTRYVLATSGQQFEIHMKMAKGTKFEGDCLACEVSIDGTVLADLLFKKAFSRNQDYSYGLKGYEIAGGMIRKFSFASLETANNAAAFNGAAAKVKHLGSIVVTVRQKHHKGVVRGKLYNAQIDNVTSISEKALKGKTLSHSIMLANPEKNQQEIRQTAASEPVKGVPNPAATFIFHYRSMEALKCMLIIPRTPSPPPLEEREAASINQDEVAEMQKQLRAMKEAQAKVKRERADDKPRRRKIRRPKAGSTQLEIDDDGDIRESSTPTPVAAEPEVIELD